MSAVSAGYQGIEIHVVVRAREFPEGVEDGVKIAFVDIDLGGEINGADLRREAAVPHILGLGLTGDIDVDFTDPIHTLNAPDLQGIGVEKGGHVHFDDEGLVDFCTDGDDNVFFRADEDVVRFVDDRLVADGRIGFGILLVFGSDSQAGSQVAGESVGPCAGCRSFGLGNFSTETVDDDIVGSGRDVDESAGRGQEFFGYQSVSLGAVEAGTNLFRHFAIDFFAKGGVSFQVDVFVELDVRIEFKVKFEIDV